MGIFCEINLNKTADGVFLPGSTISGAIKYAVDEETVFNKITISLKGYGTVLIKDKHKRKREQHYRYRKTEDYVDIDNVIQQDEKGIAVPVGSYEIMFSFKLPHDIPPSFSYYRNAIRYWVKCNIMYYIRIKFERPGLLKFAKHYKKGITVDSGITPKLPREPTIYGEQKSLFQLFSSKKNTVNIKATVATAVIAPGGKIDLTYEVANESSVTIKGIETKLLEMYTFSTTGYNDVKLSNEIENTESKTGSVKSGETKNWTSEIVVPSDKKSLEYSKIVSRDYILYITAELPMPHRNAVLEIPVQIGDILEENNIEDPPPSYWEAMGEEDKEKDHVDEEDDDDDDNEEETKKA